MTTTYVFPFVYTKAGIGTQPSSTPVVTVVDKDNNVLVNAQAATAMANMPGANVYLYSGTDGLTLIGMAHTTDTTVDQQDLFAFTPYQIPTYLDASISSRAAIADYTSARALLLDNLAYVTSGGISIAPLVLESGRLVIMAGDSYSNAEGRALEWSVNGQPWPTDLSGYTITLYAGPITKAGSVVTTTGTSRKVRVELTKAETAIAKSESYRFRLVATKGVSELATLAQGPCWVK